jgi:O-6-methylguanine DNA methyltransferase
MSPITPLRTHPASPVVEVSALRRLRADAPGDFVERVLDRLGLSGQEDFVAVPSATGVLFVVFNTSGISALTPAAAFDDDAERFADDHRSRTGRVLRATGRPPAGLAAALRTGRAGKLRYDLRAQSPFDRAVLAKALEIPPGEVRSYGWIAREIGRPRAVRAVGSALGRNPVPVLIPCHRVVRSDGRIGNYGLGVPMKRALLKAERVDVDRLDLLAGAGVRFVGSDTTGVYCTPSCPHARRIRPTHEVVFRTADAAAAAGFRACLHCRPASEAEAS